MMPSETYHRGIIMQLFDNISFCMHHVLCDVYIIEYDVQ